VELINIRAEGVDGNLVFREDVAGNGAQIHFGIDGDGLDAKFFGETSGKYMLWDESADKLIVAADLSVSGTATFTGAVDLSGATVTGMTLTASVVAPDTSDGAALGSASLKWSDLFLANGGVINFNEDMTITHASNLLTIAGGAVALGGALGMADDQILTLGSTTATAATKITMAFDESATGIGLFNMGSASVPMVLATNPGATVIANTVNVLHSAGAGDCDDLIASYEKCAVSGDGDSGLTLVGTASRAYVGTAGSSTTVASQCYGAQPWASHFGTGAITAMSGVSAKVDVNTGNFTASTVNAGHFHIEGAADVTGQFDGVMVEAYPDVTCLDSMLALMADSGATVSSGIRISGAMTNVFKLDVTTGVVTNALVPDAAPDGGTVGATKAIVCDIGGTPYYIPLYDTLHA
jgi:hypothetical protein